MHNFKVFGIENRTKHKIEDSQSKHVKEQNRNGKRKIVVF